MRLIDADKLINKIAELFRNDDFKVSEEVEENSYNIELITGNGY